MKKEKRTQHTTQNTKTHQKNKYKLKKHKRTDRDKDYTSRADRPLDGMSHDFMVTLGGGGAINFVCT